MSVRTKMASSAAARVIKTTGVALLLAGVSLGAANAGTKLGWVWANQENAASTYTPDPDYSYNSSGGAITVTPFGGGVYDVSFAGLGTALTTNVLATAYDTNGYCMVDSWGKVGSAESATVICFDASGVAANAKFALLYQSHGGTFGSAAKGSAYLWANQESAASYTPSLGYQYNSTGGVNTITRSATGFYHVLLPGFDKVGGTFQVTAYGGTAARCKVGEWGSSVEGTIVDVSCFDASGAPIDQRFNLAYSRNIPVGWNTDSTTTGVYAWTSEAKRAHYKLPGNYQFNGFFSGKLTEDRSGKGLYSVVIPGSHSVNSSNMLVTAYGYGNEYCTIRGWEPLNVACYKQGGNPVDSQFNVDFQVQGVVVGPQH